MIVNSLASINCIAVNYNVVHEDTFWFSDKFYAFLVVLFIFFTVNRLKSGIVDPTFMLFAWLSIPLEWRHREGLCYYFLSTVMDLILGVVCFSHRLAQSSGDIMILVPKWFLLSYVFLELQGQPMSTTNRSCPYPWRF